MNLSETSAGGVLASLARAWTDSDDERPFCRRAAGLLIEALGLEGAFVALRTGSYESWRAYAPEAQGEFRLGERLLDWSGEEAAPLADGESWWHPSELSVPTPLEAVLFTTKPLEAHDDSILAMLAAGLSALALGRRVVEAEGRAQRVFATAREESERANALVSQLRELTRATHEVGKTLDPHRACQELVSQLPRFMNPIHWVDVFLCKGDDWTLATGSSASTARPSDSWLYFLDKAGYPPSADLPREALAGTPFEHAGNVLLFPMRKQHEWLGLVVVATEQETETAGRDMVETLVTHTASALYNAISWEREHERSITDGLTGVYNRRFFNQRLCEETEKGDRYSRPFSLILLDLDHFKRCNDLLGHLSGDTLLKQMAALLRDNTRKVDIVARYGGEEFAVILPETPMDGARKTAEKLQRVIERFAFMDQELLPGGNVTASLGFATYPDHGRSAEELIGAADGALYSAKQAGRNRVGFPAS